MTACAGALALLAGCVADGTDFEALPFYREDRTDPSGLVRRDIPIILTTADTWPHRPRGEDPDAPEEEAEAEAEEEAEAKTDYHVRAPWPFGQWHGRGDHLYWSLIPFLVTDQPEGLITPGPAGRAMSPDGDVRADPFAHTAIDPTEGGYFAVPAVFARTRVDHDDLPDLETRDLDEDIHLWPLFAWGYGDGEEHDYLAIAPFGGTTKELIGKEKITWWGFPYPFYAKVEDRAYDSHHVLWPLINWVDGPQNSGFRVLPFYGHYERRALDGRPVYDKTWVMWPFVAWGKTGMNEERPTEYMWAWPFYGWIDGPTIRSWTVLWPFIKYEEILAPPVRRVGVQQALDDPAAGLLEEPEVVSWELRAPFPFLQIAGGPGRFKFDMWPFFGYKERPGFTRHFVLWPIWRYEHMSTPEREFVGTWLIPLYWRTRWVDVERGTAETKARLYPLLHWRSDDDGGRDFRLLSPFWFDDEGFERTLGHFFNLYRYRRDRAGGVEHQALLGLFSYRDLPAVPGRPEYTRLSLLFGMFQYRNLGGEKALRFLWLPELIRWGERRSVPL